MSEAAPTTPAAPAAAPATAATEKTGAATANVGGSQQASSVVKPAPRSSAKPSPAQKAAKPTEPARQVAPAAEGMEQEDGGEAQPEPELYEVTIEGRKERWTREKVLAEAQKSTASQRKFKEAAELTKKNQATLSRLLSEPLEVLEELGVDVDELATKRLSRKAELAMLSPEERELRDRQSQLDQREARIQAAEAREAQAREKEAYDKTMGQLEEGLVGAAQKHGLEQHPATLELMVDVAMEFHELGLPVDLDQVARETKERLEGLVSKRDSRIASGLTGEKLLEYLGPKTVEAVLQASLLKLRGAPAYKAAAPAEAEEKPSERKSRALISPDEWQRQFMR